MPFGKGRRFLGNASRAVDLVLGGWQLGGILLLRSGNIFTVGMGGDVANVGTWWQRPNRLRSGEVSNPTIDRWFDPTAFEVPQEYTFGNSGRNILRRDAYQNWDFSLLKSFPIRENVRLQLRGEFFNVLNHPSFGTPNNNINSPNVGRVFWTASAPRIGQVALKLMF